MSNSGIVIGNLAAKPEIAYTPNGKPYARFTIASSNRRLNQATNQWEDGLTDFVRCVAFGEEAEGLAHLDKGNRVIADGDWKPKEWTDKTGTLRKEREFHVTEIGASVRYQILTVARKPYNGGGGNYGGGGGGGQQQPPQQNNFNQGSDPLGGGFDEQPF